MSSEKSETTAEQPVVVRTVENTNTPEDVRKIDVSWGWRRFYFFSVTFVASLLLWMVVEPRLNRLTDPAIILLIRYCFYTIWFGMALYGAQSTVAEVAQAMAIFFSGKRVVETSAPPPATVSTTPTGTKVSTPVAGEATDPDPPAALPKGAAEETVPWQR